MLSNIQWLRWVAATLVVLFHASKVQIGEGRPPLLTGTFAHWGEAGVDIFFLISGFVMVWSQSTRPRGLWDFLGERALRILSLYWGLTLAMAAALAVLPQLFHNDSFSAFRLVTSLGMVANLGFGQFPVLFVGWTLECEALFYIVFAFVCRVMPIRQAWIGVGLIFGMAGGLGLVPFFLIEFAMGMALCSLWIRLGKPRMPAAAALFLAVLILPLTGIEGRPLIWGPVAMAILAAAVFAPQIGGRLALRLGAASYAVYLVQVLSLPVAFRLIAKVLPEADGDTRVILATVATLVAGLGLHLLVEAPLTRWLKGLKQRKVDGAVFGG